MPTSSTMDILREGIVIPAHPLALNDHRQFDEKRQAALTRYYHAAGAGGIAIGVHTTQFEIHEPEYNLYEPVLHLASAEIDALDKVSGRKTIRIAGICGSTEKACKEAQWAYRTGYHLGLLSLGGLPDAGLEELIKHCDRVAREIPLFGFYLQPAVGGRLLPVSFWRRFAQIPNVAAIKIAPFNRYQTLDVIRAVAETGRANDLALYTGNDDHIILDLVSAYLIQTDQGPVKIQMKGGLLGHWACWTKRAVEIFETCKELRNSETLPAEILTLANEVTDCNAAFFDADNHFRGSIHGIHEVLRRQGLLTNNFCLDSGSGLSYGQATEIDRVYQDYPHLNDDEFVAENLDRWLN